MSDAPPRESLWRRWVVKPIVGQFAQGIQPRKAAQAAAFGVTLGLFPILGSTTLITLIVGVSLRLNQPLLQVFRELTYPLHLATILLFIKAGESLFGVPHAALSIPLLIEHFTTHPMQFLAEFGVRGGYAICVWALMAPLLFALVYFITWLLGERLAARFARTRHAS